MYKHLSPDQDLAVSKTLHGISNVLYKPNSKPTTTALLTTDENDDFDLDAPFSAEDLQIVNSILY